MVPAPGPPDILDLEDPGITMAQLKASDKAAYDDLVKNVDDGIRPVIYSLVKTVAAAYRLRLTALIGLREILDGLADEEVIPFLAAEAYPGAKALKVREVKTLLDGLELAIRQQISDERRVLFAKVVGPKNL